MHTIIFIIPYFGTWPIWMPLFVDSIKRNPTINFLFITDCEITVFDGVPNVKINTTTFVDYVELYKKVLGDDIQILNPYKICDLRPFFGVIHEKEIEGYDFFGWTDVDLLFGDIRSFYTAYILNKNDVLSTHSIRLAGHLALLRNIEKYRKIGFEVYNWKAALLSPNFVGIDEHGMTNALTMTIFDRIAEKIGFSKNHFILDWMRKIKVRRFYFREQYSTPFTAIPWMDGTLFADQPNQWIYDKGQIRNTRDKNHLFMYLHFMNFKSNQWRSDGSDAPWQHGFEFSVSDINQKVLINELGFKNLSNSDN